MPIWWRHTNAYLMKTNKCRQVSSLSDAEAWLWFQNEEAICECSEHTKRAAKVEFLFPSVSSTLGNDCLQLLAVSLVFSQPSEIKRYVTCQACRLRDIFDRDYDVFHYTVRCLLLCLNIVRPCVVWRRHCLTMGWHKFTPFETARHNCWMCATTSMYLELGEWPWWQQGF